MRKIGVHLITGFLGSGKTTFLNHLIAAWQPRRLFVIENEVGKIGIDGALVVGGAEEVVELSSGCLCCSLHGDLREVLEIAFTKRDDYDRLVIETTGVADPASIVQLFLADPGVEKHFHLENTICLADAALLEDWLRDTDEARRQLVMADAVLLNKADSVRPAYLEKVRELLRGINPFASVWTGEQGRFPVDAVLATESFRRAGVEAREGELHGRNVHLAHDITTFTLTYTEPFDLRTLAPELYRLVLLYRHQIYRIKAIIDVIDNPTRVIVQSVRSSVLLTDGSPWEAGVRTSKIVCIGRDLRREAIERIFKRHLRPNLTPTP